MLNRFTALVSRVDKTAPTKRKIATFYVVRSYLGLVCQNKSDLIEVQPLYEDDISPCYSLELMKVPLPETLYQRLDQSTKVMRIIVDICSAGILKKS